MARSSVKRARRILSVGLLLVVALLLVGDPDDGIPDREAAGKHLRPVDYKRTIGWYTGLGNAFVLAALLASATWWAGEGPPEGETSAPRTRVPRRIVAAVAGAAIAGGALAALRLDHSFWRDEEMTARKYVDGNWYEHDGTWSFHKLRWVDTLYGYDSPNNHVGFSALARTSESIRDTIFGRGPMASEVAMRIPAWIAGIAAIVSLAALCTWLGSPGAGVIGAWLLALHPWWLRYASEARGYSISMLGATLAPLLLLRALARGSWGRWLAFGFGEFVLMWANGSLLFLLAPLNLAALVVIVKRDPSKRALRQQVPRWLVANLAGAMAWLQLMVPNLVQLGPYLERTRGTRNLTDFLIPEALSHLAAGMSWHHLHDANPAVYPELLGRSQQVPWLASGVGAIFGLALVLGAVRLWRAGAIRTGIGLTFLAAAPLAWLISYVQQEAVYPWYFAFALPGLVAIVALGLERLVQVVPRRLAGAGRPLLAALAIAGFVWLVSPAHVALTTRPIKPEREAVQLTRSDLDPRSPANDRIQTVQFPDRKQYYDPRMETIEGLDELERAIAGATREGQALYVNFGRFHHVRKHRPELMLRLHAGDFEQLAVLPGYVPESTRAVYRWKGPGPDAPEPSDRVRRRRGSKNPARKRPRPVD